MQWLLESLSMANGRRGSHGSIQGEVPEPTSHCRWQKTSGVQLGAPNPLYSVTQLRQKISLVCRYASLQPLNAFLVLLRVNEGGLSNEGGLKHQSFTRGLSLEHRSRHE